MKMKTFAKKIAERCAQPIVIGIVAAFFAFASAPASKAASINIDAASLASQVAFNFGQFEGGFSINGSTPITTGGAVFGDGNQLNFTGYWIDLGAATSLSRTVYWVNAGTPNSVADILQYTVTASGASGLATISGFFTGQVGIPLPAGVPSGNIIVAKSDGSHNPFNFSAAFLGGRVITDAPAAVPLPASLPLFAFGLGGLGLLARRKRKAD